MAGRMSNEESAREQNSYFTNGTADLSESFPCIRFA
jgi:hypothetical protein